VQTAEARNYIICNTDSCLNSAEALLFNIAPIAAHNTTSFVHHTPTILYQGTNLSLRKFWYFWPKLSQVQICSLGQDCWRMVHKTSCIMCCNEEMAGKTAPAKCKKHTSHMTSVLQCFAVTSVLQCVAVCGTTAPAKCRQHTSHMVCALIAQAFVFEKREHRF